MRLAFLTPEFVTEPVFSGGLANYLARVTAALADRGHDVHVLTRAGQPGSLDYRGVDVHRVVPVWDRRMRVDRVDRFVPRSHYTAYHDLKSAWSLRRRWLELNREKPFDLTQAANVAGTALFFRFERRSPIVTRLSSYRPLWDRLSGAPDTPNLRKRWLIEKLSIQATRYHYAPSEFVARLAEQNCRVSRVGVVESPFFQEQPDPDPAFHDTYLEGLPYLLFFGRHTRMKGPHVLSRALPEILSRHPCLHVVFIGADTTLAPDGGSMHAYICRTNPGYLDRLHIFKALRHDALYPVVQNARLVVLPSLADNLPNTCLEAMGLDRPVVATTGSCFEQLITHGKNGFLSEPGDPASLACAVLQALALPDAELQAIGRRAGRSLARLHPAKAVPDLIAYYESVIRRHAGLDSHPRSLPAASNPRCA